MEIPEHSAHELQKMLTESGKPVIAEFFTSSCKPCRRISPVLQEIGRDFSKRINIVRLDAWLTGTPLAANVGANPVQLDISAQYDASNSQAFTITVSAPAPPTPSFSLRRVTKYERAFKSAIVQNRFSSYSGYNVKEKLWRGLRKTDPRKV